MSLVDPEAIRLSTGLTVSRAEERAFKVRLEFKVLGPRQFAMGSD
jgi:hypothetical protein